MSDTVPGTDPGALHVTSPVLVLGGTGRTGGRVLTALLARGVPVRAIVRSASRLPAGAADHALLTVVEAEVLTMPAADLTAALDGCGAVVSCLGHPISVRGVMGPPRHLVEDAVRRVYDVARILQPEPLLRVVLMSSVSVNRPDHADTRRGGFERAVLAVLRAVVPPAKDNQRAADLLVHDVGTTDRFVQWVVVRPDTLRDGDLSPYHLSEQLTASLFRPDETAMANVADFMADLVCDPLTWQRWVGRMPVITNADAGASDVDPAASKS